MLGGLGAVVGGITLLAIPFLVVPWLPRRVYGALPYTPTSKRRVALMLDVVHSRLGSLAGRRFIDLGSGDGVAVMAAAQRGMAADGVELNGVLVGLSKLRSLLASLSGRHRASGGSSAFWIGNLFEADVRGYDCILIFGVGPLMPRLSAKLRQEAKDGCVVVSHRFPLGHGWVPFRVEDSMLFYELPAAIARSKGMAGAGKALGSDDGGDDDFSGGDAPPPPPEAFASAEDEAWYHSVSGRHDA